jgi:DNA (cytosine-5)-methyltransferase 1
MIQPDELIVDNFAGGGGASTAIELALGRPVDIAINHDPEAIAMHAVNHPRTRHLCEDVWQVDIAAVIAGRKVGLAWFSPDCKHFSKAKGGKPVEKRIRGLAWVAAKWAELVRPRVIMLENVEEFQDWAPLHEGGEFCDACNQYPADRSIGKPCPLQRGVTFEEWLSKFDRLGYDEDHRELRASRYGAPTIRKRLFVVLRRDGLPITWPEETHGEGLLPYRTAAECIDWSIPCPSIFLTKQDGRAIGVKRPLVHATMGRIARGVKRYVIDAAEPFIVNLTHQGGDRAESVRQPLRTVTGARRGEKALVTPILAGLGGRMGQSPERPVGVPYHTITAKADTALIVPFVERQFTQSAGNDIADPLGTTTAGGGGKSALVAAFLTEHANASDQRIFSAGQPLRTQCAQVKGGHFALATSHLVKLRGTNTGSAATEPVHTISAGGTHIGEVRAFLMKYYGTDQDPRLTEPMHTLTTKHRLALVMVRGVAYVITDIGMRMLTPRELFRAQGFPDDYVIEMGWDFSTGNYQPLSKTAQVKMCGNSVSPPPAEALIRAQFGLNTRSMAA